MLNKKPTPVITSLVDRRFNDFTVEEMPQVMLDLNVKSVTCTMETICFGIRSATPTVTLPRASVERSTISEIKEEIRDALVRLTKQSAPMNKWLEETPIEDEI